MHPFEEKLIRRVAREAAFVRECGRYSIRLSAIWPSLAVIAFFGSLELLWYVQWGPRRGGEWVTTIFAFSTVLSVTAVNIRSLFFKKLQTGQSLQNNATGLQVALNAGGFSLDWTRNNEAAILFALTGSGKKKERHAVVFIPAEGHIWYTVHDPAGMQYFVRNRKPLEHLVQILEEYFRPEEKRKL